MKVFAAASHPGSVMKHVSKPIDCHAHDVAVVLFSVTAIAYGSTISGYSKCLAKRC